MSALHLRYDARVDRLRATLRPSSESEAAQVQQDKVMLWIDRRQKLVVAFEVADFSHFVSYHLLDELFGDEAVREIAAFQSKVVATSHRIQEIQIPPLPRSSRRVVDELLRAA